MTVGLETCDEEGLEALAGDGLILGLTLGATANLKDLSGVVSVLCRIFQKFVNYRKDSCLLETKSVQPFCLFDF